MRDIRRVFRFLKLRRFWLCTTLIGLWIQSGIYPLELLSQKPRHIPFALSADGSLTVGFFQHAYIESPSPKVKIYDHTAGIHESEIIVLQEASTYVETKFGFFIGSGFIGMESNIGEMYGRQVTGISVPFWLLLMLSLAGPLHRRMVRRRLAFRNEHGLCQECGYDLRASPIRCPECGANTKGTS